MQLENYLLYLEKTAAASSDKVQKHLVKKFIEEGIAVKNSNVSGQLCLKGFETVDISDKSLTEQLLACLHASERARLLYERWEFEKDYKYSVVFSCDNFPDLFKTVSQINPLQDICENEYISTSFEKPVVPVAYHTTEYSFLKFNLIFAAVHPLTQEEFLLKYPFLVVFHPNGELIEFRFDVVKRLFVSGKQETTIYADLIASMRAYLEKNFSCKLSPLDMDFMVNASNTEPTVKLIAQFMKLPNGGKAQLEVGNNQEYVLPVIGELKALLSAFQTELESIPDFKDALEQFMYEMEEMSDYPWIELLWENEIKTRGIHVKFIFNYMRNDYCLIQHYSSNVLIGMERMNHVIKYIIRHRNDDQGQTE